MPEKERIKAPRRRAAPPLVPRQPKIAPRSSWFHLAAAAVLALVCVLAYGNSIRNGFVWDDTEQIVQNPQLQRGQPLAPLFSSGVWAFAKDYRMANNYYRPLPMLVFREIVQLWGFDAQAFHSVMIIFHFLACLAAYVLFLRLTRGNWQAFAAAALFAVHPIHTEAVDWISCLSELGCALFFIGAFLCYLSATGNSALDSPAQPGTKLRAKLWWVASWLCFGCALLWKEMALALPLVIGAHVLFFSAETVSARARIQKAVLVGLPYLAVFFGYLLLRRQALGFLYHPQRNWILSPLQYLLSDVRLVGGYWLNLLLPIRLNAYHVFDPAVSLADPGILASILFLFASVAVIAYCYRRAPLPAFAATWVFVTLIPVLNLRELGRNALAERYLYIPSIGFCLLLVWIGSKLSDLLPQRYRVTAAMCALVLLTGVYCEQTSARNLDWKDNFTLFSRTLEVSPNAALIQLQVADSLLNEKNDPADAEPHYLASIAIAEKEVPPERQQIALAYADLAMIYGQQGQFVEALGALDGVKAADPNDPDVQTERGVVLAESGQWQQARTTFEEALEKDHNSVNAIAGLGNIALNNLHDDPQAIEYFQRALRIHTKADTFAASLHNGIGAAYCESNRCVEAIPELQRAVELAPKEPLYHVNLGKALAILDHLDEARMEFERALAVDPGYAPARDFLAELNAKPSHK